MNTEFYEVEREDGKKYNMPMSFYQFGHVLGKIY